MSKYKMFVGKEIITDSGKAVVKSVCGKYGALQYLECDGSGWVDLSKYND